MYVGSFGARLVCVAEEADVQLFANVLFVETIWQVPGLQSRALIGNDGDNAGMSVGKVVGGRAAVYIEAPEYSHTETGLLCCRFAIGH